MKELLTSMFIDNHREGRDLEDMDDMEEEMGEARDMDDENEDESNLVEDDEADAEDTGVEVVSSKDPQEIARFNNYMDAIYRYVHISLLSNRLCVVHSSNRSLSHALSPINSSHQEDERCSEGQVDGPNGPQHERQGGEEGQEGQEEESGKVR